MISDLPGEGLAESQMLNMSSLSTSTRGSGRLASTSVGEGRPSSAMSENDDDESDWDSWDDDDEEEVKQIMVFFCLS